MEWWTRGFSDTILKSAESVRLFFFATRANVPPMIKRIAVFISLLIFPGWGFPAPVAEPRPVALESSERPLWEIGLFGGAARLPHYRGSDEYRLYVLPLPYIIYRGEIVRANREGLKGIFWATDRFETALSFSGSPPVDDDNDARKGMPELGAILEVGPGFKFFITERGNPDPLYLTAGVRTAISVDTDDFGTAYRGIRGGVKLVYRNRTWLENQRTTLGLNAGIDFANREYNDYIYSVDPGYAVPGRPAYRADGGYTGFSVSANAVKKLTGRWSVAAYYRWDNLSGTAYADSPLVKTENNHIIGCALIWTIFQSEETSRYQSE